MQWSRLLFVPSFGTALVGSMVALCAFVTWIMLDASFHCVFDLLRMDFRLDEHPGMDLWPTHNWQNLGPRLLCFGGLAFVATCSVLLMFYNLFFGVPQQRSLRLWFVAVAVISVWLALFLSYNRLLDAGFQLRVRRMLSGLKQDVPQLVSHWPESDGELPYLGQYTVDEEIVIPKAFLQMRAYDFTEPVGMINRLEDGGINFQVSSSRWLMWVDYRPDDRPRPVDDVPATRISERLEPHWFLDRFAIPD